MNLTSSDDPHLLYRTGLEDVPRQATLAQLQDRDGSSRAEYALASDRIARDAAVKVCEEGGATFRIIVFAWKRRASLKRLVSSLQAAEYFKCTVHLDFYLDGGAHSAVREYIKGIVWERGRVRITDHVSRLGLEEASGQLGCGRLALGRF